MTSVWLEELLSLSADGQRRNCQRGISTLMELGRRRALTPKAVEGVGATARGLKARVAEAIPESSAEHRQVGFAVGRRGGTVGPDSTNNAIRCWPASAVLAPTPVAAQD